MRGVSCDTQKTGPWLCAKSRWSDSPTFSGRWNQQNKLPKRLVSLDEIVFHSFFFFFVVLKFNSPHILLLYVHAREVTLVTEGSQTTFARALSFYNVLFLKALISFCQSEGSLLWNHQGLFLETKKGSAKGSLCMPVSVSNCCSWATTQTILPVHPQECLDLVLMKPFNYTATFQGC